MKFYKFIKENIFFIFTLFLLAFIPLYPKLPIVNVQHTWVYIRAEDFVVALSITLWIFLVLFRKVKLKTPLTLPIFIFWIIGAISTLHGVLILFPTLSNVFPNVAFLSLVRRIEYMSLFFIAYESIKDKKFIYTIISVLAVVLVLIVGYGVGQKFLGFPAFLTGNEEFAKGIPLQISSLARVPSTFGGDYDLAAYLVLVIPIFVSLIFGFRNLLVRFALLITAALGFGLLFLTVSRVSFFVLMLSLIILLVLQKKKLAIISLLFLTAIFLIFSPSLLNRFGKTAVEVNVLVNADTGEALGQVREVPHSYFKDKTVLIEHGVISPIFSTATSSAIIPYSMLPDPGQILIPSNVSNGENLPQGTGYVNLPLSPILKRADQYFLETNSKEIHSFPGNFLVKRATAYDLSFTTRFQGEWPKTIDAFKRNIFLGSGYGSVSLAVDNDYLRILGESGILGLISFVSLFVIAGIYIKKALPQVDSPVVRSFVLGFIMGSLGLVLNGALIDVFEASKIAFTYWLLMGITLGMVHLFSREENINILKEFRKTLTSPFAVCIYIFVIVFALLFPLYSNYFVGDDFTWLRWATDSKQNIIDIFTQANGFFYRPGTRLYFSLMYQFFWLNQTFYHLFSLGLHFVVACLLLVVTRRILKDYVLSIATVLIFLFLSGYHEAVFWISSTGFLFNAAFTLSALLFYIYWKEKRKNIYLILSLVSIIFSMLFHEIGVISPLIIIAYDLVFSGKNILGNLFKKTYLILLFPLLPYLILRIIASSHWLSGDYNYSIIKLPFNVIGNVFGYFTLDLFGAGALSFYEILRNFSKTHIIFAILESLVLIFFAVVFYKKIFIKLEDRERKILTFGFLFFIISLLPFLGLGNIASRYSYLSAIGFAIVFALFIKRIFNFLISISDKYIASALAFLLVMVYLSLQLFQLQKIHTDWQVAGVKAQTFLISFESFYKDYWEEKNMHFYFVNVPIRNGEAWVFPVGLKDALWFALQGKTSNVDIVSDLDSALNQAYVSKDTEVFDLDSNATVKQVLPRKSTEKVLPIK